MRFSYTDTNGVERVMEARNETHARMTVRAIEFERSGSHAAAEIAVNGVRPEACDSDEVRA